MRSILVQGCGPEAGALDRGLGHDRREFYNGKNTLPRPVEIRGPSGSMPVCGVEVIRWVRKTLLCKSAECRRVYDLERKRVARAKIKRIGIEGPTFQRYLGPMVPEPPKDELRKTCDDAVKRYLDNGGKITRLPDENAGENVLFLADLADARLVNPVSH